MPEHPRSDRPGATLAIDAGALRRADLAAVDSLARAALRARREGRQPVVTGPSPDLRRLVELCGLADPLGVA